MSDYLRTMRKKVGAEKILVPTTACILIDESGKILMQERAGENRWGCPGGIMDIHENVFRSVQREVFEETGLTINDATLFGIYSGPRYEATYPNGDMTQSVLMVFLSKNFSAELTPDDESAALQFFPLFSLPQPIGLHHSEYVEHYLEYVAGKKDIPVIVGRPNL